MLPTVYVINCSCPVTSVVLCHPPHTPGWRCPHWEVLPPQSCGSPEKRRLNTDGRRHHQTHATSATYKVPHKCLFVLTFLTVFIWDKLWQLLNVLDIYMRHFNTEPASRWCTTGLQVIANSCQYQSVNLLCFTKNSHQIIFPQLAIVVARPQTISQYFQ